MDTRDDWQVVSDWIGRRIDDFGLPDDSGVVDAILDGTAIDAAWADDLEHRPVIAHCQHPGHGHHRRHGTHPYAWAAARDRRTSPPSWASRFNEYVRDFIEAAEYADVVCRCASTPVLPDE